MILNSPTDTEALTGVRKAAMLLIVLGDQASATILPQLSEDDIQKVSREVARITSISSEQAESLLNEFHQISTARDFVARGGLEVARKLLTKSFPPDVARRLLERLQKAMGADAASFDAIQKADPQLLAKFVHSEHP